ncbi:MAG: class I SAM-dependent methyltransferase [Kiritimatiellae bacterium]|nr:class I SAM-dependent methyltransferase [Kiritimatiellia bacterium]
MTEKKFNPQKLDKLNNPDRMLDVPPAYIWDKLNLHLKNSGLFIDIGAGTGFFAIPFLEYSNGGKIYACDISDIMIGWMQDNICDIYPSILPLQMEEHTVPLEDDLADLVYMISLHHEIDEPEKLLKEAFRLLQDNGTIFIVDWKKEEMSAGPPTSIRYEPGKVEEELCNAGFRKIKIYDEMKKHFLVVGQK